ncbi:MAG: methyltransferase domain-containing protein [Pseudonocardiaceae bacterium]|nr:methyltransferase domain-containing protein [Pseudonocardiaceae bacterium]
MTMPSTSALELADALVTGGAVRSTWLRRAFEEIPRHVFVPRFFRSEAGCEVLIDGDSAEQHDEWLRGVYTDEALTVQLTSTHDETIAVGRPTSSSSAPTVMAGMLEALDLEPGHRVLEIGTGTGYNAALLSHRVGAANVVTIELDRGLAGAASRALAEIGLHPSVQVGDGNVGVPESAPFDRIIATASVDHVPPAWITQLAPGGAIVADLRGSLSGSLVWLIAAAADVAEGRFLDLPGAFMPMRTRLDSPLRDGETWHQVLDQRNPQRATTPVNAAPAADCPSLRFLLQLHLAGRRVRGFLRSPGNTELSGHATDASWFTVGLRADDDGLFPVAQGGLGRLWDTVEACWALWHRLGQPGIERFGVTAPDVADLQYVWLDHPDSGYRWPLPL